MDIKELKKLGKKAIVKRAVEAAKSRFPSFDPKAFDRTRVMVNDEGVWVSFTNPVTYIPRKAAFYEDLDVQLELGSLELGQTSSRIAKNPEEGTSPDEPPFPVKTTGWEKAVAFVLDAINKSGEMGRFERGAIPADTRVRIYGRTGHYDVQIVGTYTEYDFSVRKTSGKIYDISHADLARSPEFGEPSVEIE